jgi:N-acetylmuramoyl-L-alanine amidase
MRRSVKAVLCFLILICVIMPGPVYGGSEDMGFEGGISSGDASAKTPLQYQEVCLVSGEAIVLKGTLTVKKTIKQGTVSATYTYALENPDKNATLKRTFTYNTKLTEKDNNQIVAETSPYGKFVETISINGSTYTLSKFDFSRSSLIDSRPAINYYAGNLSGRKVYKIASGNSSQSDEGSVTLDVTGNFYGYDQYWGTAEAQELKYVIQSEKKNGTKVDKWGGTADVTLATSTEKQIKYVDNKPNEISFEGGYVQVQNYSSIMEYSTRLPEFDSSGKASDNLIEKKDSIKLETFPVQTRLPVPDLKHLKGHWSYNDIQTLYSLEVLKGNASTFNPAQYMTRAEFARAVVQAAKEVPDNPYLTGKTTTAKSAKTSGKTVNMPFEDVPKDSVYLNDINSAYERGLVNGKGEGIFAPDDYLTVAEALTIFIRALGLEGLAPASGAITSFRDNDSIPGYARNAACVAEIIGLIYGDDKGYLNPGEKLTNARASALINRFIGYMREGIRKDYKEKILNF